jgi:phospholipid/cholesterol/gamma-HCH transport system substrate-binding protein
MNSNDANKSLKFKVGLYTFAGILLAGYLTVYVNDQPYWWRPCRVSNITVEDATGLKSKSPVKSLGLEIGYIRGVDLTAEGVRLKICVTAPVEVTAETRAYVRSEGFLGDKFLELKPVKLKDEEKDDHSAILRPFLPLAAWVFVGATAHAEGGDSTHVERDIPVGERSADFQKIMNELSGLVTEVRGVTKNLNSALNPEDLKSVVKQLNKTLENASAALNPETGITSTAQRALLKLEDAIEQLRDQLTRVNQGKGSVGKILNEDVYATELEKALKNLNALLGKASEFRFVVSLGFSQLNAYNSSRGAFELQLWTRPERYYRLGVASDPRGNILATTTTTEVAGTSTTVNSTRTERGDFSITAMVGQVFAERVNLSIGVLYGDGVTRLAYDSGWGEYKDSLQPFVELYFRPNAASTLWTVRPDVRTGLFVQPFSVFTLTGGIEGLRRVNGRQSFFFGAGIRFDDNDIKLLASFL